MVPVPRGRLPALDGTGLPGAGGARTCEFWWGLRYWACQAMDGWVQSCCCCFLAVTADVAAAAADDDGGCDSNDSAARLRRSTVWALSGGRSYTAGRPACCGAGDAPPPATPVSAAATHGGAAQEMWFGSFCALCEDHRTVTVWGARALRSTHLRFSCTTCICLVGRYTHVSPATPQLSMQGLAAACMRFVLAPCQLPAPFLSGLPAPFLVRLACTLSCQACLHPFLSGLPAPFLIGPACTLFCGACLHPPLLGLPAPFGAAVVLAAHPACKAALWPLILLPFTQPSAMCNQSTACGLSKVRSGRCAFIINNPTQPCSKALLF